uniref:EF-hand domain-containing protein n=1 Tax=Parasteatoda tepidariorum TaxID=114398 RepID=A0A2L2Y802_PARTP|nr:multiple coagulation factor deficiency protein 2 homolog [Parasteatoda tepidariorum]
MSVFALEIIVLFSLFFLISCHNHGPQNFQNVQDRDHLKQHLDGMDADELKDEELRFHYFNAHDIDGNKKLDGLEILQAFTHYHATDPTSDKHENAAYSDLELQTAIDPLLVSAIDKNQDGYLDYAEFIQAEKTLKEGQT